LSNDIYVNAYGIIGNARGVKISLFQAAMHGDIEVISSFLSMPDVSGRHDVGRGNVDTLQHLQSDRRSGAFLKPTYPV